MFGDLTLLDVLLATAMWLLIGAVTYGQQTLTGWKLATLTPPVKDIPANVRAAGEGWMAAQNKRDGVENNPFAAMMGPQWLDAPVILEWAAANITLKVAENAWQVIFLWPLVYLRLLAYFIAKGVNSVVLPEVRERSLAAMRVALAERAKEEADMQAHRELRHNDFDAINELLNRDRGEDDEFGPVAQLL